MEDRVRKVNVEAMKVEDVEALSQVMGEKLRALIDQTCDEANKMLNIYGLEAKMQFVFQPKTPIETEQQGA